LAEMVHVAEDQCDYRPHRHFVRSRPRQALMDARNELPN
jgi:hypothetical protein